MTIKQLLGYQYLQTEYLPGLEELVNTSDCEDIRWIILQALNYGYIEGKRADRAKRKKHNKRN